MRTTRVLYLLAMVVLVAALLGCSSDNIVDPDALTPDQQAIQDLVIRHLERGDSLETTLAQSDQELGDFARLPLYGFLKERSISGVYNRLSRQR